jgi:hypothetical protein
MDEQAIKRYYQDCDRRHAALLKRGEATFARIIALSSGPPSPDPGNVEDIQFHREVDLKLKAYRDAKAAEDPFLDLIASRARSEDSSFSMQEFVAAREGLYAAMLASQEALEDLVAHLEANQRRRSQLGQP